jgi:uncharacterized protein
MTAANGIGWFEIGTDRPAEAERFYGDVFGWTFADDGMPGGYRIVTTPDRDGLRGGLFPTGGDIPNYAVFVVRVADTAETCRRVEAAGGKVVAGPKEAPSGLTFAYLHDPAGNQLGVFTPAPGDA